MNIIFAKDKLLDKRSWTFTVRTLEQPLPKQQKNNLVNTPKKYIE